MRRLFLIRHAKAEPSVGRDDFERTLTDRGREGCPAGRRGARRPPHVARRTHSFRRGAGEGDGRDLPSTSGRAASTCKRNSGLYDAAQSSAAWPAPARSPTRTSALVSLDTIPGLASWPAALIGSGAGARTCIRLAAEISDRRGRRARLFRPALGGRRAPSGGMLALYVTPGELAADAD